MNSTLVPASKTLRIKRFAAFALEVLRKRMALIFLVLLLVGLTLAPFH